MELAAHLAIPDRAAAAVICAHAGSRLRFRDQFAMTLNQAGLGTLLVGLLTPEEELSHSRSNVRQMAGRLIGITRWLLRHPAACRLPVGYLGADLGSAAALWTAAAEPRVPVEAIVCVAGRPDLAWPQLGNVRPPTLIIVGGADEMLIGVNRQAEGQLTRDSELVVIPGATDMLGEPGSLGKAARLAAGWFTRYLTK